MADTLDSAPSPYRGLTFVWILTVLALFPILVILGFFLRALQADYMTKPRPEWFYAVMTLHGLGMVGTWYVGSMAGVSYLLSRYVKPSVVISRIAFGATLLGVVLLLACTLIGRLGVGWYFLYPLPLHSKGVWPAWATAAFLGSLGVFGVGWTIWSLDLLRAIAQRYSFSAAMAWHYLRGKQNPEVPPLVLIVTVSMVSSLAGFVAAVVLLVLYVLELLGGFNNDALLMKNLTFFFGHVLVNITMYLGVAVVYELLPAYAGRPWKTNKIMALAWNTVLFLVMFAYLHHLYMDFAQPQWLQYLGQISSYLISVPAAVVSIFGALLLVYRSRMRWNLVSLLMCFGVMGWAIGGVAAVIDSTVAVNLRFHNTLWVPAHFHTYYLMGVVLMILAFAYYLGEQGSGIAERQGLTKLIVALIVLGGYGFLMMFYYGGAHSVPRRYAHYPEEVSQGIGQARVALVFISLLLVGLALYLWETARRCFKALSASSASS